MAQDKTLSQNLELTGVESTGEVLGKGSYRKVEKVLVTERKIICS